MPGDPSVRGGSVGGADVGRRRRGESPDVALARLAAAQHGVVARRQLLELGLGRGGVAHRLAEGRLHVVHRGVYAVGHERLLPHGRAMAAVLAVGPHALVSHLSAAALWDLVAHRRRLVDVTALRGRGRRPGIAVHLVRRLAPADAASRHGVPVTSVARTLLDLAEQLPAARLDAVLESAERLRLLDMRAFDDAPSRWPGRRGLAPLAAALERLRPAPDTRSPLERRFVALCRSAGLPEPATNVVVAGYEVDAAWPQARLVVELDSRAFHLSPAAFERDRVRDADLQLAGWRVLRVTHRRLQADGDRVLAAIRTLLGSG